VQLLINRGAASNSNNKRIHLTTEGIMGMVRMGVQHKNGGAVSNPY